MLLPHEVYIWLIDAGTAAEHIECFSSLRRNIWW